jgi:peroxiredoxin
MTTSVTASAANAPRRGPTTLAIGAKAPDFSLPGVEGKKHGLKDFAAAKVLVIVFTCNHCPTAQAYEQRINQLVADYRKKGVAVVAVSPNDPASVRLNELGYTDLGDSFNDMLIRAKAAKFTFPYLYDGKTQAMARAYGPRVTPHVFIFDAERKLRYVGRIDNSEDERRVTSRDARAAIDALLAGRPVPVETTRAFGCSIKWAGKRSAVEAYMKKLAAEKVSLEKIDAAGVAELRKNRSDKIRLINVWATWCGPCIVEFPALVETNRMYRHRAFEFVTISVDLPDRSGEVLPFLTKQQASSTNYLYDSSDRDALAEALDNQWSGALPLTILVRPGGEIAYRHEGIINPLELRRAIVKLLGKRYRK